MTDYVADPDVTLPANVFPPNALTEIHGGATGNYTSLGDVPSVDANTKTAIARAAYDFIESGSLVHLFALPFPVAQSDDAPTRAGKVVTAINTALNSAVERAKMPNSTADIIIVPRETVAGTAANPIYSALEVQCAPNKIGAVGLVDAGGGAALSNTARPLDTEPTDANVALWGANNRNLHIYAVSNRADISHYDRMWGSVIAGAHHARYTSREGIGAHPWNLRDPVLGIGQTYPQRVFDESDGSSAAVKLDRDDKIASLINFQGIQYLWGGESYATEEDPRQIIGNQIVANRMIKRAKRVMAPFLKARRRGTTLDTSAPEHRAALAAALRAGLRYVGGSARARHCPGPHQRHPGRRLLRVRGQRGPGGRVVLRRAGIGPHRPAKPLPTRGER